jgi:hypothetical protein
MKRGCPIHSLDSKSKSTRPHAHHPHAVFAEGSTTRVVFEYAHPLSLALPSRLRKRSAGAAATLASSAEHACAPKICMFSMCSADSWVRRPRPAIRVPTASSGTHSKHQRGTCTAWHNGVTCKHCRNSVGSVLTSGAPAVDPQLPQVGATVRRGYTLIQQSQSVTLTTRQIVLFRFCNQC